MLTEEAQSELETLESIFGEDFKWNEEEKSVEIKVVPSAGAEINNVGVLFSAKIVEEYPSCNLNEIKLSVLEGNVSEDLLDWFCFQLREKAAEWGGEPVIWRLVDYLTDELKVVNEDASHGSFSVFPFEVMMNIFQRLTPEDLCSLSMASKSIQQFSDSDFLWQQINEECFAGKVIDLGEGDELPKSEKEKYLHYYRLKTPRWRFIASVVDRKGTGDEWFNSGRTWQEKFKEEMQHHLFLINRKRIIFEGHVVGHIKFYDIRSVEMEFGSYQWFKGEKVQSNCPYVGEIIGYIKWEMYDMKSEITKAITSISRGAALNLGIRGQWELCLKKRKTHLWEVVNVPDVRSTGIMVIPRECRNKNRYMNELVDTINWKLKGKMASTGHTAYLDYVSDEGLYPMKLDPISFQAKMKAKFEMWAYNWDNLLNSLMPNEPRICTMLYTLDHHLLPQSPLCSAYLTSPSDKLTRIVVLHPRDTPS